MTFGSLFSGIGGLDLGLERAGMKCVWQVEKDPYAIRVLKKHWPAVTKWRDVRYFLGGKRWRSCSAAWHVDLVCGGFPCQPFSLAGKLAGESDSRFLWPEFNRIIRLLRPCWVVLENVPGLLSLGLGRVLRDLATGGYDAEWFCLPAAAFGAPYIRERVFIVGWWARNVAVDGRESCRKERQRLEEARAGLWTPGAGPSDVLHSESTADVDGEYERKVPRSAFAKPQRKFQGPITKSDWWSAEPDVVRVVSGFPGRVDQIRGLGNAVVPQVAQWIGERIMQMSGEKTCQQ